jgi:hypothetical protein
VPSLPGGDTTAPESNGGKGGFAMVIIGVETVPLPWNWLSERIAFGTQGAPGALSGDPWEAGSAEDVQALEHFDPASSGRIRCCREHRQAKDQWERRRQRLFNFFSSCVPGQARFTDVPEACVPTAWPG